MRSRFFHVVESLSFDRRNRTNRFLRFVSAKDPFRANLNSPREKNGPGSGGEQREPKAGREEGGSTRVPQWEKVLPAVAGAGNWRCEGRSFARAGWMVRKRSAIEAGNAVRRDRARRHLTFLVTVRRYHFLCSSMRGEPDRLSQSLERKLARFSFTGVKKFFYRDIENLLLLPLSLSFSLCVSLVSCSVPQSFHASKARACSIGFAEALRVSVQRYDPPRLRIHLWEFASVRPDPKQTVDPAIEPLCNFPLSVLRIFNVWNEFLLRQFDPSTNRWFSHRAIVTCARTFC